MRTTLVIAVLSAAVGFGAAWKLQGHQLTKQELNHANERIAIARANRAALERNQNAVLAAQNAATVRAVAMRRDVDAARAAAVGLRDDIDVASRAAATSLDACTVTATTYGRLLIASVEEYRSLAAVCTRHVSDLRTFVESWPQ